MRERPLLTLAALLFIATPTVHSAGLVTAGALHVDLTATNGSANSTTWTNQGALGNFTRVGNPSYVANVAGTGIPGVFLDGSSYYVGPATTADLEGASDRSIEVWVYNPSIPEEETLVSWGHRGGPDGSNMSFNYGNNLTYGAVGHWGSYDVGWPSAGQVPTANEWHHIVYTYDGNRTTRIYVDGQQRTSKLLPGPLLTWTGDTINLGAQRADATTFTFFLNGYLNTVRVHGGMLSSNDVAANFAYGPAFVPPSGPVTIVSQPTDQSAGEGGAAIFSITATGQLPITYQWYRNSIAVPDATNRTFTVQNIKPEDSDTEFFVIARNVADAVAYSATSSVARLNVLRAAATLTHRWSFSGSATDSVGTAHGILSGGAAVASGELVLNGSSAFVDLPNNLVAGYSAITVEAWVIDNGSANWARIFDFGNNSGGEGGQGTGSQYMFLSLPSGAGNLRYAITTSGNGAEQLVEWPGGRPAAGQKVHVVITTDAGSRQGRLYVNGQLVGQSDSVSLSPGDLGSTVNNWIGKSNWPDPYFNGRIDEFRIYSSALSQAKILETLELGPDQPLSDGPVTIFAQPTNTVAVENSQALFTVKVSGRPPFRTQWTKNGTPIPGGTNLTLVYYPALSDSTASFQAHVTNFVDGTAHSVSSQPVSVQVLVDTAAPRLIRAAGAGATGFEVLFSEFVSTDAATRLQNYQLTGPGGTPVTLTGATLNPDGVSVLISSGTLQFGQTYTLAVSGVQDRAASPNTLVATNTTFVAAPFRLRDIGTPSTPSSLVGTGGGYDITIGGSAIAEQSDSLALGFSEQSGDFDLSVRLGSLGLSDAWARAGLMARAGLSTNDSFAATWATPGPGGCFFEWRADGKLSRVGSFPVNYPDTWLRLRRTGNVFAGFASLDGQTWTPLGSVSMALPATLQVGLALSSQSVNPTTASFRNYGTATGMIAPSAPLPFEPMAPSSRKTGLVISEVMYNPPDAWATSSLEFIEIHNPDIFAEDLTGYTLEGDVRFNFPAGTQIRSGEHLVIARNPVALEAFYGLNNVLGPFTNNLPNEGGTVRLVNDVGGWVLEVNYRDKAPWPVQADGAGHSLVLRRPSYGEDDPRAWMASDVIGGSPGRLDGWGAEPLRDVVINEFLANSDPPTLDFVELFNAGLTPVNLSGAWLSDDPTTNKYRIPDGTILAARSFISFDELTLGFALSSDGDEITLVNPARTRVLQAVRFGAQAAQVSRGRSPDGTSLWSELAVRTPGTNNSPALQRDVIINEIMYHPLSDANNDEYIELFNRGATAVSLAGWRISDGVSFTFPPEAVIPVGGYVVVAENLTNLLTRYPHLSSANTFGNYSGSLNNGGERLVVESPLVTVRTNRSGVVSTNISYISQNEVTYQDGGRWGEWSDGGGSSLELTDPRADNRFAANWEDSDETAKAGWTMIDYTGLLDLGMGQTFGNPDRLEIFLQDKGECLVDDVECRSAANATVNRITDPGFEIEDGSWVAQGTHRPSVIEQGVGVGQSKALHVKAVDRGDPGPNKIRTAIALMPTSQNGTIRAKARWLRGSPELIIRLRGQWLEAAVRLDVPATLGTPGQPNSRRVANRAPAIAETTHSPVLPAAGQPVVVSARVVDPDGIGSVTLRYRIDPANALTDVAMNDNGVGGDALAGDGVFSGTIPAQNAGVLVAFHVRAIDAAAAPLTATFPANFPATECLVRFGETQFPGAAGTYRFWITQATLDTWDLRERNSNEPLDCTFAYGNSRVMYNVGTLYSASPWHTANHPYTGPLGPTLSDYELNFPSDDRFLGSQDFVLAGQDLFTTFFNNDMTAQGELTCYWFGRKLGLQYNHKRIVRVVLNGQLRGMLYFDHQQPNGEIVSQYFPGDEEGKLFKIEDWFEFDDLGNSFNVQTARLLNHLSGGVKKTARYRYNFRPRSVEGSPNDFADLFALVDAATAPGPEPYTSATFGLMDVEEWMRVFALQHAIGNWDSYGYRRGKNCFTYKPTQGPWKLLLWDLELSLGKQSDGPTHNLFDLGSATAVDQGEPTVERMYNHPPFRRLFWRALYDLVNGAMQTGQYAPMQRARFESLRAQGFPVEDPMSLQSWIEARRAYILSQIPAANFNVTSPANSSTGTNFINLTGTAPVNADQIVVNGAAYPITWTSQTAWSMRVPLLSGANSLAVSALDSSGQVLSNGTQVVSVTVTNTIAVPDPEGQVLISEIMYNPLSAETSYIELFNNHPTYTFDLSNWRLNGVDYTFPAGSVFPPKSYLVLGRNRSEFALLFGATRLVFDEFNGGLDNDGETLTLFRPGPQPNTEIIVDRVKYENVAPWPIIDGTADAALQLLDIAQDNSRAGNWTDGTGWRFFSFTNTLTSISNRLSLYFDSAGGNLLIDDISLVQGTVPGQGQNLLINGGFEGSLLPAWKMGPLATNSSITTETARSGASSLRLIVNPGAASLTTFYQDFTLLQTNTMHTLSFWWKVGAPSANLNARVTSNFRGVLNSAAGGGRASPGLPNTVSATLAPYPLVWLNEVSVLNTAGFSDSAGDREPWIELYNSSTSPISLEGFYLSDSYSRLDRWAFPAGATIQPGEYKVVIADGEPGESTAAQWHTSFRLTSGVGSVALARTLGGSPDLVDYLNFNTSTPNSSYGSLPDGQLFDRQTFYVVTPGAANTDVTPTLVRINEWVAANTSASGFADPADGDYDDWFELFNPGATPVDLAGYYLTDTLTNQTQYRIPAGYVIPPGGFLLVWADNETGQNNSNRLDLHANFRLGQNGDAIGLFAPDSSPVDTIEFGAQTNNISQGRYADGADSIYYFTTPTPRAPNVRDQTGGNPEFTSMPSVSGGVVGLTINTLAGRSYQVQYKNNLQDTAWQPLGQAIPGTGGLVNITDPIGALPHRFYRVVLLP